MFVDDRSAPLFPIGLGSLPWQPILGDVSKITFTWQAGLSKRVGIWKFRFKNIQWQRCRYIVCEYDHDQSSNPRDYEGNNCTFFRRDGKNGHILPNILASTGANITSFSALVDICTKIFNLT